MVVGYDSWLAQPGKLEEVERFWKKLDRSELVKKIMEHQPKTVLEICCGTGWIPLDLPMDVNYFGIDANEGCIKLATEKNPLRKFFCCDLLDPGSWPGGTFDMVLGFSCLKHFTLDRWDEIYTKMLFRGAKTLSTVYLRNRDIEEAKHPYVHTAVTPGHMERVIKKAGHRVLDIFTLPPLNTWPEPLVLTEYVDVPEDTERTEGSRGADLVPTEGLRDHGA